MTPQESREIFIESIMPDKDIVRLKDNGLYQQYVEGKISVEDIYVEVRDQGI
jgi:hypothetical protein